MKPNEVQETKENKPWYKQGKYYLLLSVLIITLSVLSASASSENKKAELNTDQQSATAVSGFNNVTTTANPQIAPSVDSNVNLSNNNYYTNTYGNQVHSPAYSNNSSVPAGASARCVDRTYSFSQRRRGTCSHHGGVAEWME